MRRMPNTMRVGGAAALPAYVAERGGSAQRVLHEAGLVAADLREPQAWLDIDRLGVLHEAAAHELGDPNFGLHFGQATPLHAYGLLSHVVLHAPTVRIALNNLVRFANHLAGVWAASLVHDARHVRMGFTYVTDRPDAYRQYVESIGAVLCVMMKTLAGTTWTPREVCFQHSIGQAKRRPSVILEAPVRFERPANEIVFAASTLDTVVVGADRTLLPMFEERANELTGAALVTPEIGASGDRLVAAVQEEVVRCLCDGPPQLARIARTLAMSSRTLQRELQRRGVRFKTLVNETRHRLSLVYLERPELSVTEIAFLLGYAELSAFDRAFRRAAGVSPRAWRSASR